MREKRQANTDISKPRIDRKGGVNQLKTDGGLLQRKVNTDGSATVQRAYNLNARANPVSSQPVQRKPNKTGMPNQLKSGIENLSGHSMDDVKVNYNSSKPAQLSAHAYAQGTDIHLGTGQEKHLPHEAWHVVQQKQGRVQPTTQLKAKVTQLVKLPDRTYKTTDAGSLRNKDDLAKIESDFKAGTDVIIVNGDTKKWKKSLFTENHVFCSIGTKEGWVNESKLTGTPEPNYEHETAGKYIGYTFGSEHEKGGKPTLYFENGHYTQHHSHEDNVGWHPSSDSIHFEPGAKHVFKNVKKSDVLKANLDPTKKHEARFKLVKHQSEEPTKDHQLMEAWHKNGKVVGTHPSRGALIYKDSEKHETFVNNEYLKDATKELNSNYALNELPTRNKANVMNAMIEQ